MLIRLDDLKAAQGATFRQSRRRIVANDSGDGIHVGLFLVAVEGLVRGAAVRFVGGGVVVLGQYRLTARRREAVEQGAA
jgi:hypothetical protein